MQKIARILVVVLSVGMGGLAYGAVEGTSTVQTVEASITPQLEISVNPTSLLTWSTNLTIGGANSMVGSITIKSNGLYDIRIRCSDSTVLKMKEYCKGTPTCTLQCTGSYAAGYVTAAGVHNLQYSMTGLGDGSDLTIANTYVDVYSSEPVTANAGDLKNVTFKQPIGYVDAELNSAPANNGVGHTYRMGIYWFATQAL
ncbi:MAG: hypothetical protein KKA99_06890 [Gammaproteobacteria bacterium]|nr:hypothetical protein [Gammaproteobacteria bacterium]